LPDKKEQNLMKNNRFAITLALVLGLIVILTFIAQTGQAAPTVDSSVKLNASTPRSTQQGCVLPPGGLTAWWPGNGDALDIQGGNHGTLQNGAAFAPGMVGQAFSFDGVDDFVQAPDSDLWAFGAADFTIDFWANFNTQPGGTVGSPGAVFINNDEGSGTTNKWVFGLGGGVLVFHINGPSISSVFLVQAPFIPNLNQWYHLAVTKNGDTYTIYVDGNPAGSETNSVVIPNPNAPLNIGQAEGLFFTDGLMDEVHIFERALSALEIQTIFNAGSAGLCTDMIYLPMVIREQ
jgi:Concanavalin A-like lectin/glucanases superfamily